MAPLSIQADGASSEEEDYMAMAIPDTKSSLKETPIQRRMRLKREAEDRSRPKSKAELKIEEDAAREDALSKSLFDQSKASKGMAMMAKMGFKPGSALGKKTVREEEEVAVGSVDKEGRRIEPIGINMKEDRGGIGLDTEKKRKFQAEFEGEVKRVKAEEGEYRERVRREREEARQEAQFGAASRVAERMTAERQEAESGEAEEVNGRKRTVPAVPLKSVNILWRGQVRRREEKERNRRMRFDLQQSLSRLPTYDDPTEDAEDRNALGRNVVQHTLVEDLEEEDPELDEFSALEPRERLQKVVDYLRDRFNYCFWCKYAYPDKVMDGCPGLTEEEHD